MATEETDARIQKPTGQPAVIGIYGISGAGKSFLLHRMTEAANFEPFAFYEGADVIASLVPGGLDDFHKLNEEEKVQWRQAAIAHIAKESALANRTAIVTGHLMFWDANQGRGLPVYTQADLDTYTHILYLDAPAERIVQQRQADTDRHRTPLSSEELQLWKNEEIESLRSLCLDNGILFSLLQPRPHEDLVAKALTLLRDFRLHTEEHNACRARAELQRALGGDGENRVQTMLVIDADKTLSPQDSGYLCCKAAAASRIDGLVEEKDTLKAIFSSALGYSYSAFRQATLFFEELADDVIFENLCQKAASQIVMRPEFVTLLRRVSQSPYVGAVVVTCGVRRVWEHVLEKYGFSQAIPIIGGGRVADGFVVTPTVKASLVAHLRNANKVYVWAFGDSPLDLPMLAEADRAVVVVGKERTRSKTMDGALAKAILQGGLKAQQALLPSNVPPRLDTEKLPVVRLTDPEISDSIFRLRRDTPPLDVVHATHRTSARCLMTPMRDATVSGPALREAHRRAGWYVATEFATDVIGLEEFSIPHVQGHQTPGFRLRDEQQTLIVALLRGGEPMAFGVNDAFPLAMFVHAKKPDDVQPEQLRGKQTVLLVDSVVNSGKSVAEFITRIHEMAGSSIRIVVVAGVTHASSVSRGTSLYHAAEEHGNVTLISLRFSENQFTGKGTTDTGNRLFNTTHIP